MNLRHGLRAVPPDKKCKGRPGARESGRLGGFLLLYQGLAE